MSNQADLQRRGTACHEAGHAVVGLVVGIPFARVTIEPDHDSIGHVIAVDPWAVAKQWEQRGKLRDISSAFRAKIIALMAGAEAERVLLGTEAAGDDDDRNQILLLIESGYVDIDGKDWPTYEARLRAQTHRLIRRYQPKIERVAKVLLERGTLQADEIMALVA